MTESARANAIDADALGREMFALLRRLYPICRSITGAGVRQTLDCLRDHIPLTVHEVPTGTQLFDWTVPKEWNIRDAWVKNPAGEKVIDFKKCNLHVVGYSVPQRRRLSLSELKLHLHTLPEHPDWIPNRTSYYKETWGFCLSHNTFQRLEDGEYEVCIDSSLDDGHLTYAECALKGAWDDEVLISTHICHPSLCNDNLSGIVLATMLARHLAGTSLRHTYRFLFIPTTIGSIAWLYRNESHVSKIKHGLVLTCLGDAGGFTYKKTRRGDAHIDRACLHVLERSGRPFQLLEFSPDGGDERQYSSPAFDLPVGVVMRTAYGQFPEYHTSADDLDFVSASALGDSFATLLQIIFVLENDRKYFNRNPKCEPHFGKRGIRLAGERPFGHSSEQPLLWVLNLSDGQHSLLDIADRAGLAFHYVKQAADVLVNHKLLDELGTQGSAQ
jgi:aminopeptidase-like protein